MPFHGSRFTAKWIQPAAVILIMGMAVSVSVVSWATRPPSLPEDPYEDYQIRIVADRHFGVVPFAVDFRIVVTGNETLETVRWDFDSDGSVDAQGPMVSHTFPDPIDYEVTAEIRTTFHGRLFRTIRVSGHTALMTITFDDGPQSIHEHGFPLLASKGVTATAYIVPAWVGMEWYIQWEQVDELHEAGWTIGSHSLTHPRLTQTDDPDLHHELSQSQNELQARGIPARHFAVPYGDYDARVLDAIGLYYDTNRITGGQNPLPEAVDRYLLGSHVSLNWMQLHHYSAEIDSAVDRRAWYIMCNHTVAPGCGGERWCITTEMLSDVIDYAHSNRVKIVNMDEAFEMMAPDQAIPGAGIVADGPADTTSPIQGLQVIRGYRQATVSYEIVSPTQLGIRIFDVRGRLVSPLLDKHQGIGEHTVIWNGTDSYGRPVEAGIYFCEVKAGDARECRKIQLVH